MGQNNQLNQIIQDIEKLSFQLFQKDFLLTWEKSQDDLMATLHTAKALKWLHQQNIKTRLFDSGLAISIFRDKSTRTRFSYSSAANLIGLAVQELDEEKSQISHGETVRETANMISFLTEVIGIRDDMFLGEGNTYMKEVGSALNDGFEAGVLNQRPSIVNLQCDLDHPTQSMADLLHLIETFGGIDKLKGKKVAMTWAYSPSYGKPLSVPQGIISLLPRFGMDVRLAYPEGYHLSSEVVDTAHKNAQNYGGKLSVMNSMDDAFKDADIVYPKSWAPYAVMEKRTELLMKSDKQGLQDLEKQCLAQNAKFKNWECDEQKMKLTSQGKALYMHCLPADITDVSCKAGEVSKSVFDRYKYDTYKEAGYKPFIIAAMMMLSRFKDPAKTLQTLYNYKLPRVF